MPSRFTPLLRRLAALLAALAVPALAQMPIVPGEPAQGPKEARPAAQLRLEAKVEAEPALRARARLAPVSAAELASVNTANAGVAPGSKRKRLVIGLVRSREATPALPSAASLAWVPVPGGVAAQMAISSPDAAALRVALDLAGAPAALEMVFAGSGNPSHLVGPVRVSDIPDRTAPWWSPVTEGETQTVEFFMPGAKDGRPIALRAVEVSHLFAGPSSRFEKRVQDIGLAGSCNVDLPCSSLVSDAAFRNAASAVAQMVFNDGGFVGICTGTLLNDTDGSTQIPWFYSANHCFDNEAAPFKTAAEMQTVASSLDTLWFFEASACNSGTPGAAYREMPSGATFIYNNPTSDVLFLRLNGTPPAGAFFAGWDANPISAGTVVLDAHHPQGDLKKVSRGSVLGFTTPPDPPQSSGVNQYIAIRWSSGTTEQGSSGSAIFTFDGTRYSLRGGLWGGGASCSTPTAPDEFSRLDLAYPALAAYLSPANVPAFDVTDMWWNPNESGWGLNLTEHASHIVFALWYTYDASGQRIWYSMSSGQWTSPTSYTGALYQTAAPPANGPFDPNLVVRTQVGTATLNFADANTGTLSYSVNGVSGIKNITRYPF
jgi:hypothetical protein